MLVSKSFKGRLYPNKKQINQIEQTIGAVRFVYNMCLNKRIDVYKSTGTTFGYTACAKYITEQKTVLPWLYDVDSTALQRSARHLDDAFQAFFAHNSGYPKFKSKKRTKPSYTSVNNTNSIDVKDGYVKLPKLGWTKVRGLPSEIKGKILSATVSRTKTGKYFVSVACENVEVNELPKTHKTTGLDLGISSLITFSDGTQLPSFAFSKKSQNKIIRMQQQLSRKKKGSNNYYKLLHKIAIEFEKLCNRRTDAYNKLSFQIVKDYDLIGTEDLSVKSLLMHGSHSLAFNISDAAWGELIRMISYKADWYGKQHIKVDKYFPSSQLCNHCGYINAALKDLSIREWTCPECGQVHNRDINAARNILDEVCRLSTA